MAELTLHVSEQLAKKLAPLSAWLDTVLELSLLGCKTTAAAVVADIVEFLGQAPTPEQVLSCQVSEAVQTRLQRLLALNSAGLLGATEQQELDELEQVEHIMVMLKARAAEQLQLRRF